MEGTEVSARRSSASSSLMLHYSIARVRNQELKHIMGSYGTVLRDRTIHIDLCHHFS